MPGMPASVKNSAHSDHRKAAVTPTDTRVSMVAAPWRAFVQAARWKGSAPHTTTGEARVSESHCQLSNCSQGTIDIATTGTVSTAETTRRCHHRAASSSRSVAGSVSSPGVVPVAAGGAGTTAP